MLYHKALRWHRFSQTRHQQEESERRRICNVRSISASSWIFLREHGLWIHGPRGASNLCSRAAVQESQSPQTADTFTGAETEQCKSIVNLQSLLLPPSSLFSSPSTSLNPSLNCLAISTPSSSSSSSLLPRPNIRQLFNIPTSTLPFLSVSRLPS